MRGATIWPSRSPRSRRRPRAHGAEIVIVEDDATDAATAALAARHGARYVALGRPRGINVARNAAVGGLER